MRSIDIPTANGIPYASVACLGFDARVNELANKPHKYFTGRSVYIYAVLKTLKSFEPFNVSISNGRNVWHGSIMMAAVANGCCYGGGMKIAPEADMEDGLLNICIVRKTGKWTLVKEFPRVFKGKHTEHPNVITLTGRTITITSEKEQKVFADGENISQLPLTCSISNNRLNILQPVHNS
jgi:diacylglycerol kinase family enzyme